MHSLRASGRGSRPRRWTRISEGEAPASSRFTGRMATEACVPGRLVVPMKESTLSNFTVGKWGACFTRCDSRKSRRLLTSLFKAGDLSGMLRAKAAE